VTILTERPGARLVVGVDTLGAVQPQGPSSDGHRRFVVCGVNPLAARLIDVLINQYDAQVTAVVKSARSEWAPLITGLPGVEVIESDRLDAAAFTRARLAEAHGLALVDQDDAGNIDAALLAQEINPDIRTVVRMFNNSLGERINELLTNSAVLSAAAITAPAFVAAALDDTSTAPMTVADRTLVGTPRSNAKAEDIVAGLAVMAGRDEPERLPPDDRDADFVLARTRQRPRPPNPRRRSSALRMVSLALDAKIRRVLLALLVLFLAGTTIITLVDGRHPLEAAYIALLTEFGGATADTSAPIAVRLTIILLTFVSIGVIPVLTAMVVDSVVRARLRIEAGGLVEPLSDHVVVVGLGDVGTRVVRALDDFGLTVVAIDRDPQARGVRLARSRRIPLIIGDATHTDVLNAASVATCKTLVVVSTDDASNLETALLGRTANPAVRVVMRLFDGEFADRVQRAFAINVSRSVSYLAAPAFAAALLGREILGTIPVDRHVLLVAEVPVGEDSALERLTVGDLQQPHEARVIAIRAPGERVLWAPPPGRPLRRTDLLVVVATRVGLSTLLNQAAPGQVADNTPYRLLSPWQTPHERAAAAPESSAASTEGPPEIPPFGPADAGSTRPA
jgi:Trk K+ transport system NAD-binding subunit